MSFDVDNVVNLSLAVVSGEATPPRDPEARWMWLSTLWSATFCLAREAGVPFDVNSRQVASGHHVGETGAKLALRLGSLATITVRLHENRESPEHREQAVRHLKLVVEDLCHAMLSVGQAIGWHPRHIGAEQYTAIQGFRQQVAIHALHLRGSLTPDRVALCYRRVLDGSCEDGSDHFDTTLTLLNEMERALYPWRKVFWEMEIPLSAVSGQLMALRGTGRAALLRLIKRAVHDVDCIVQGAHAWRGGREVPLVPMMFATQRLSADLKEMREMLAGDRKGIIDADHAQDRIS